jgi:pilus assembly protein CpaF
MPTVNSTLSGSLAWAATQQSGRLGMSPVELQKRAHQRLAERIDLAKSRHKPLSILRQEARRIVDQYYEYEQPGLAKADREKLVEDVLGESYGFGPLEELFRDDSAREIMVLAHNQVIVKKGVDWLPTSTRFRDAAQYRSYLQRLTEVGEPLAPGLACALDMKLPNGYRVVGILPPEILDQPPLFVFHRGETPPPTGSTVIINESRPMPARTSGVVTNVGRPGLSAVSPSANTMRQVTAQGTPPPRSSPEVDPFAKVKQRVTERIVATCAAAGMYDLSQIPTAELQKVVEAHIGEVVAHERLSLEPAVLGRLTVEILAAMHR